MTLTPRARFAALLGAVAAYALAYPLLHAVVGRGAASLLVVLPFAGGSLYGWRGGILAGLLSYPVAAAWAWLAVGEVWDYAGTGAYYVVLDVAIGAVVGRVQDLRHALKREVAERRAAESAARESGALWASVFEQAPERISVLDLDGTVRKANFEREAGRPVVGANAADLVPEPSREAWKRALARVVEAGERASFEITTHDALGDERTHWVSLGPIRKDGKVVAVLRFTTDATDRKHKELALRRSEKLSALGTLVAGVAHEINNPLAYMQGNVELSQAAIEDLLASGRIGPDDRKVLEEIAMMQATTLRGVERVAEITKGLRRVSRATGGARSRVDVNGLVESALVVGRSRLGPHGATDVDLRATRLVEANEGEIGQAILNLLLNAGDATREVPSPRVAVRTRDENGSVVIDVEDNGPGIPADEHAKIFTPFHTTKPEGTGLGLSVSYRIVEDHGGSLTFASRAGRGTCFTLRLPAK